MGTRAQRRPFRTVPSPWPLSKGALTHEVVHPGGVFLSIPHTVSESVSAKINRTRETFDLVPRIMGAQGSGTLAWNKAPQQWPPLPILPSPCFYQDINVCPHHVSFVI